MQSGHPIHIVCGPPASGKTTYGKKLAKNLKAAFLDSDDVCNRLIAAGLSLAELDPEDRDSPIYKSTYRDAVYETLFDLTATISPVAPVVIAGPFTAESQSPKWPEQLKQRLGQAVTIHFIQCDPEQRKKQMKARGEARDIAKLNNWDAHQKSCFHGPPPFKCENHSPESSGN